MCYKAINGFIVYGAKMENKLPKNLNEKIYLSKKAGSFAGVPQRTVQNWTDQGLIVSETTGTGDRRRYSPLNIVELAIIKRLADDRTPFKHVAQIMGHLRKVDLKKRLKYDFSYLVVKAIPGKDKLNIYGQDFNKGEENREWWFNATASKNSEKVTVYNLGIIAERILRAIKKEE